MTLKQKRVAAKRRQRVTVSTNQELLEKLDQQATKLNKSIQEFTLLLSLAHTATILNGKAKPVLKNCYRALNGIISSRSTVVTAKLYLAKLMGLRKALKKQKRENTQSSEQAEM